MDTASEKINCLLNGSLRHGQFNHMIIRVRAYRVPMFPLHFITGHQVSIVSIHEHELVTVLRLLTIARIPLCPWNHL